MPEVKVYRPCKICGELTKIPDVWFAWSPVMGYVMSVVAMKGFLGLNSRVDPGDNIRLGVLEMKNMTRSLVNFLKREDGPTAVEYAVMLALIIVVCIIAITALGSNASGTFNYVSTQVSTTAS